jgi:hypothetical protein
MKLINSWKKQQCYCFSLMIIVSRESKKTDYLFLSVSLSLSLSLSLLHQQCMICHVFTKRISWTCGGWKWRCRQAILLRYSDDDSPTGDKDSKFYTKDTCVAIVTQLSNNGNNWFTGFVWK